MLLFLSILFPYAGIAFLVSTTFATHAPRPRAEGLARLNASNRLAYVYNPLTNVSPTPSMWLVILPDSATRSKVLQGHASTVIAASTAV